MFKYIGTLFFLSISLCGLYAEPHICLTKNQILLTNDGIYVDYNGSLAKASSLIYFDECYCASIVSPQIAGHCGNCGSRRTAEGRCENQNCENSGRNGPRERD